MTPKRTALIFAALFAANTAQAAVTCTFAQECFETDGCMASTFQLSVEPAQDTDLQVVTEFGTVPVVHAERPAGGLVALASSPETGRYLLSYAPEGARLSVHLDGPLAVTYIGHCEGMI